MVLIHFWGTWCSSPCLASIPGLKLISRRMQTDPFVIVSIGTDLEEETLRKLRRQGPPGLAPGLGQGREIAGRWKILSFPTCILVNEKGEVLYNLRGWSEPDQRKLQVRIADAIREARKSAANPVQK